MSLRTLSLLLCVVWLLARTLPPPEVNSRRHADATPAAPNPFIAKHPAEYIARTPYRDDTPQQHLAEVPIPPRPTTDAERRLYFVRVFPCYRYAAELLCDNRYVEAGVYLDRLARELADPYGRAADIAHRQLQTWHYAIDLQTRGQWRTHYFQAAEVCGSLLQFDFASTLIRKYVILLLPYSGRELGWYTYIEMLRRAGATRQELRHYRWMLAGKLRQSEEVSDEPAQIYRSGILSADDAVETYCNRSTFAWMDDGAWEVVQAIAREHKRLAQPSERRLRHGLLTALSKIGDTAGRDAWFKYILDTLGDESEEAAELAWEYYQEVLASNKKSPQELAEYCGRMAKRFAKTSISYSFLIQFHCYQYAEGRKTEAIEGLRTIVDRFDVRPRLDPPPIYDHVAQQLVPPFRTPLLKFLRGLPTEELSRWCEEAGDYHSALDFTLRRGDGLGTCGTGRDEAIVARTRRLAKLRRRIDETGFDIERIWKIALRDVRTVDTLAPLIADDYARRDDLNTLAARLRDLEALARTMPRYTTDETSNRIELGATSVELFAARLQDLLPLYRFRNARAMPELWFHYARVFERPLGPWPEGYESFEQPQGYARQLLLSIPNETRAWLTKMRPYLNTSSDHFRKLALQVGEKQAIDELHERVARLHQSPLDKVMSLEGRREFQQTLNEHYSDSRHYYKAREELAECVVSHNLLPQPARAEFSAKWKERFVGWNQAVRNVAYYNGDEGPPISQFATAPPALP